MRHPQFCAMMSALMLIVYEIRSSVPGLHASVYGQIATGSALGLAIAWGIEACVSAWRDRS